LPDFAVIDGLLSFGIICNLGPHAPRNKDDTKIAAATAYFIQEYLDPKTLFICDLLDKFLERRLFSSAVGAKIENR
jgi:hypothetical protein